MAHSGWTRGHSIGLAVLLLSMLLMSSEFWLHVLPRNGDNAEFVLRAMSVAEGHRFHPAREAAIAETKVALVQPPILPLLLAPPLALTGSMAVTKIWFYLLQALSVFAFWWALMRFRVPPLPAALVTAFSLLTMHELAPLVNVDVLYAFLAPALGLLLALAVQEERSPRHFALLGVAFGLLVCVRYSGVSWVLPATIWLAILAVRHRSRARWTQTGGFIGGGLLVAVLLLVWLFWNDPHFLEWYTGVHTGEGGETAAASSPLARIPINVVIYVKKFVFALGRTFIEPTPLVLLVAAAMIGIALVGVWRERRSPWLGLLLLFVLLHPTVFLISWMPNMRYLYPLVPLFMILFALGAVEVERRLAAQSAGRWRLAVLLLAGLVVYKGLALAGPVADRLQHGEEAVFTPGEREYMAAIRYLDEHYGDGAVYIHTKMNIPSTHTGMRGIDPDDFAGRMDRLTREIAAFDTVVVILDSVWGDPNGVEPWLESSVRPRPEEVFVQGGTRVIQIVPGASDR